MSAAVNRTTRIAVHGDVDMNLVDGSSVWVQSVCLTLASIEATEVTLLLRTPVRPYRELLVAPLRAHGQIKVVDPVKGRLSPPEVVDRLERLDRARPFDLVLVRGSGALHEIAERGVFDGRLWPYIMLARGLPGNAVLRLAELAHRVLGQTETVLDEIQTLAPGSRDKLLVLPPIIPAAEPGVRHRPGRPLRLVYSGKFAPEYCSLEMIDCLRALREVVPAAELHVIGDKIHRAPGAPDFAVRTERALRGTGGVRWHGAVPRAQVHALLGRCDLALSIRPPQVEGRRELSTKVLEYGAAGLPVLLNRAPVYEELLGPDYPLFLADPQQAVSLLTTSALDPDVRRSAARACLEASREFAMPKVAQRLAPHLPGQVRPPGGERRPQSSVLVVAGHDLKFIDPIRRAASAAGATLVEDLWRNHGQHTVADSRVALAAADVVLCEWCLGNAGWYSRNIGLDQRLVIRLHRMEVDTEYPRHVALDRVHAVAVVSKHIRDEVVGRFGWNPDKIRVIPNAIDTRALARPKRAEAAFALGLIGYAPMLKRLDRALDLLERLRVEDPRFFLVVVGHPPSAFGWITRREEEVTFFQEAFRRVQGSERLRGAVQFRPFTKDLPALLERVGFLISVSDSEGHQVSLAEGASSGAVPVVLDRPGAAEQYPARWIHQSTKQAAQAVLEIREHALEEERAAAREHALRWSYERIVPEWTDVLGLSSRPHPDRPTRTSTR